MRRLGPRDGPGKARPRLAVDDAHAVGIAAQELDAQRLAGVQTAQREPRREIAEQALEARRRQRRREHDRRGSVTARA